MNNNNPQHQAKIRELRTQLDEAIARCAELINQANKQNLKAAKILDELRNLQMKLGNDTA